MVTLIYILVGAVTAFISSRPNMGLTSSTNITQVPKPVIVAPTQPLLLPKPHVQQKQVRIVSK